MRWRRVTALHCVSSLRFVAARAHCCTSPHVTSPLLSSSLLESYFDPTTSAFDRNLTHSYPEWHPDFKYHGHNPYALLIAAFGSVVTGVGVVPTFEWVMIQFYESWAHMNYNVTARMPRQSPAEYLAAWVPQLLEGWSVDFSSDPAVALPTQRVALLPSQVLLGVRNGWSDGAGGAKSLLVMPDDCGAAWRALPNMTRGFGWWVISEEGDVPEGQSEPLYMAPALNEFLRTR